MAEALALGGLVKAGVPVRLTGQDTRRGTFNQRHSVLLDIENEQEYVPLNTSHRARRAAKSIIQRSPRRAYWDSSTATAGTIPKRW